MLYREHGSALHGFKDLLIKLALPNIPLFVVQGIMDIKSLCYIVEIVVVAEWLYVQVHIWSCEL
ncbi:MAG: hypothetical protein DRO40_02425 [Thermoprotei archaeon]|nr:MAG: hypothetical protein DRO40_02425 [Thermoprotei archaeon]